MDTIMKEIDIIAFFDKSGDINPLRFRFSENNTEENKVIPVHKILSKKQEFFNGNIMYVFECQSFINDINKLYAIKYEIGKNKWYLCKI